MSSLQDVELEQVTVAPPDAIFTTEETSTEEPPHILLPA